MQLVKKRKQIKLHGAVEPPGGKAHAGREEHKVPFTAVGCCEAESTGSSGRCRKTARAPLDKAKQTKPLLGTLRSAVQYICNRVVHSDQQYNAIIITV
eukprot:1156087-Pelagomonas_calceolata.AAC.7